MGWFETDKSGLSFLLSFFLLVLVGVCGGAKDHAATAVNATTVSSCSGAEYFDFEYETKTGHLSEGDERWFFVSLDDFGRLSVYINGSSAADFDLFVYESCGSEAVCAGQGAGSVESCSVNVVFPRNY